MMPPSDKETTTAPSAKNVSLEYAPKKAALPVKNAKISGLVSVLFWCIFFTAMTAYQIHWQWNRPVKAATMTIIILFVLLTLFSYLTLCIVLWARPKTTVAYRKMTLRKLYDRYRQYYTAPCEIVFSTITATRTKNRFYWESTRELERFKFQWIADIKDMAGERIWPEFTFATRFMTTMDGRITASFHAIRQPLGMRILLTLLRKRVEIPGLSLVTRLSNGTVLCTEFEKVQTIEALPNYLTESVPWNGRIAALVYRHEQRLREQLVKNPDVRALPLMDQQAIRGFIEIERKHLGAAMQARGYLKREDITILFGQGNETTPKQWIEAFEQMLAEIEGAAAPAAVFPPGQEKPG